MTKETIPASAPEYRLPAPETEAGRALYERAVDLIGEPYSRAYAEEVRVMVLVIERVAREERRALWDHINELTATLAAVVR